MTFACPVGHHMRWPVPSSPDSQTMELARVQAAHASLRLQAQNQDDRLALHSHLPESVLLDRGWPKPGS